MLGILSVFILSPYETTNNLILAVIVGTILFTFASQWVEIKSKEDKILYEFLTFLMYGFLLLVLIYDFTYTRMMPNIIEMKEIFIIKYT